MISKILLLITSFSFLGHAAYAEKLYVVTSTPDVAWIVNKIGGDKVKTESLLDGSEDPHFVDAMPHFIAKVARADVVCSVGLELEIGWMPKVLTKSGNADVQSGGRGFCELGRMVDALEKKTNIDRSMGDVHPSGNPHFHLGPTEFLKSGLEVLGVLSTVSPENEKYFTKNYQTLSTEIEALKIKIKDLLKPVKDEKFIEYHKEFTYFLKEFGLRSVGSIEAIPGVPPSAGQIAKVSIAAKKGGLYLAIATRNAPVDTLDKFTEFSGVPHVFLPLGVRTFDSPKTYDKLLLTIAERIVSEKSSKEKKSK